MGDVTYGRYLVGERLGRGGSGEVLSAHDPLLGREVAIKVLRPDRVAEADRFEREARVLAGLAHPGIVSVFDLGRTSDGRPFLVMRRVAGASLAELSEGPRLPLARAIDLFLRVCDAVGHAHRLGVVHRDLKPANIMVGEDGEVLVLDWGTARSTGGVGTSSPGETLQGTVVGTPGYLAPEMAEGDVSAHGPRSDVFSLGAVLYELLAGRPAMEEPSALQGAALRIVPLRERVPDVDPDLAAVCDRCLKPLPADRFPDAHALAASLRAWRDGEARRAEVSARVAEGRLRLERWQEQSARAAADRARVRGTTLPRGLALDDPRKVALFEEQLALDQLEVELAEAFAAIETSAHRALALEPGSAEARALLADACFVRAVEAESGDDARALHYWRARLAAHDDGSRRQRLEAPGRVSLETDPPGARVTAFRWDTRPLVWTLRDARELGRTPLREAELPAGSWLLRLQLPDRPEVSLPVRVWRGRRLTLGLGGTLPLPDAATLGEGWVYVPAGPFVRGGDPDVSFPRPAETVDLPGFLVARHATTAEEYAAFLEHLAERGEDWAARVPRVPTGGARGGGALWPGRPPFRFPLTDSHGDVWDARWPVCAIAHDDAVAYAAWRGARLVGDDEYEKAARGADGRRFPWGDRFDTAVVKCGETRPGRALPEPVGAVPTDRSPYGVHDLAGSMRTWCREPSFEGDPRMRPIRGGNWGASERVCRAANRYGIEAVAVQAYLGIRLARDLPPNQETP